MRTICTIGYLLMLCPAAAAQDTTDERPAMRYGLNAHLREFPQGTPKEALASVILAMEQGRIDYLLAQLSNPEFVDNRVKQVHGGKFEDLISETRTKLNDNPAVIKELRHFLQDGDWQIADNAASVQLKDLKNRQVHLKKIGERWFFENKQSSKETKE
jgi:hypothetical protein